MIAYIDGSYCDTKKLSSWAVVFLTKEGSRHCSGGTTKDFISSRNVTGEIYAAIEAISIALDMGLKEIEIAYDYTGIQKWFDKEWEAKSGIAKHYRCFIDKRCKDIKVTFTKIKAHSGNMFNDMADKIANFYLGR
jgi:ribonuclease H-related protein